MLKNTESLFTYHIQAAVQSFNQLCRKPVSTMMTLIVIGIALALPTFFWALTDNVGHVTMNWQKGGHISLYLKTALSETQQKALLDSVRNTAGVGDASIKTAQEGLDELTREEGMHDIMRYLPENPIPPVIEVIPALALDTLAKLDTLSRQLQGLPEVEIAKLDMEWISRLHAILGFMSTVADVLMMLLSLAVILIIGNTLRLAIHNKQEEIQILKLIGATDPYIIRPFLYSGIWYGVVGAVFAIILVNICILSLGVAANKLANAYQMHYPFFGLSIRQMLLLILFSVILGWVGAWFSVKRQLAYIEPNN